MQLLSHSRNIVVFGLLLVAARSQAAPYRYWPTFPAPGTIVRVSRQAVGDERFLLQSLAGLSARRARQGGRREYVWVETDQPAYRAWHAQLVRRYHPKVVTVPTVWDLLRRLRQDGTVRGYVRFAPDRSDRGAYSHALEPSANAATMACGPLSAVLISDALSAKADGLPELLDASKMTERQAYDRFRGQLSRKVVGLIDPKVPELRSDAIAMDAPVAGVDKPTFETMLDGAEKDIPILGWCVGDEWEFTSISSRHGAFQTATNWCANLALLSTMPLDEPRPARRHDVWDLPWETGVHYAAFLLSDGDNVQWESGSFKSEKWWSAPGRGAFPMGWTSCQADLSQLAPAALSSLSRDATDNDDLVLMSGGYYYPDLYPKEALQLHAKRIGGYVDQCGITALSCLTDRWDSPAARAAYAQLLGAMPRLEGVLPIQYAPYNAGLGKVIWQGDIPVVSARCMMWADLKLPMTGDPEQVASMLNRQATIGGEATEAGFSWVTVHAWSSFPSPTYGESSTGFGAVERCVANLDPNVRVVTPTDLLRLMRLRLRPRTTLDRLLTALERQSPRNPKVRLARNAWRRGDWPTAFRIGKQVARP